MVERGFSPVKVLHYNRGTDLPYPTQTTPISSPTNTSSPTSTSTSSNPVDSPVHTSTSSNPVDSPVQPEGHTSTSTSSNPDRSTVQPENHTNTSNRHGENQPTLNPQNPQHQGTGAAEHAYAQPQIDAIPSTNDDPDKPVDDVIKSWFTQPIRKGDVTYPPYAKWTLADLQRVQKKKQVLSNHGKIYLYLLKGTQTSASYTTFNHLKNDATAWYTPWNKQQTTSTSAIVRAIALANEQTNDEQTNDTAS